MFCSYARCTETFELSFHSKFLPLVSLNTLNISNKRKEKTSFLPSKQVVFKVWSWRNSLVVQWLGLSVLTARARVQSLVGGGSQKKKKKCGLWTTSISITQHSLAMQILRLDLRPAESEALQVGLPWWHNGKESTYQCRDTGLISDLGRSHKPWSN